VTAANGGIVENPDHSFTVRASHLYTQGAVGVVFEVVVSDTGNGNQDSQSAIIDVLQMNNPGGHFGPG
jgi:hypothetical protein